MLEPEPPPITMCHSSRSRPGPVPVPRTCQPRHPHRRIRRRQLFPPCWPWTRTSHCRRRRCPAAAESSVPPMMGRRPSRRCRQPKRRRRRHPVAGPAAEAEGAGPARFRCFHLRCYRRIRRRCCRSSSSCRLFAQNDKTERNFIYELRSDVIMSCKIPTQPQRSRNHERRHHILRGLPLCSAFVESPQLSRWLEREKGSLLDADWFDSIPWPYLFPAHIDNQA